ncbi:ATP-binding protein [Streptomyces purpurogeneiscleroticus]|uniref:ATP-binding protein n=1 Tax=Streptomyces purpurogeneiscleroticus TaxID=68259 RepID=UPI001CC18E99|nr:ATP-binding protein [Streptomyces purpurogeneiscleroticus]MBZ4016248.1 hypothetical protein [Streptomyces purpurogeneiscleroticus]
MADTVASPLREASPVAPRLPGGDRHRAAQSCPNATKATGVTVFSKCRTIVLPAQALHVRTARRFTEDLLIRWGVTKEDRASVLLIVSELATNAAQHGGADMAVTVSLEGRLLQVEVADFGERAAPPRTHCGDDNADDDEHGRGLGIVTFLADHTEAHQEDGGWRVRAAIDIPGGIHA